MGEKQTHCERMTRKINEDLKSKNEWNCINDMKFLISNVKYSNIIESIIGIQNDQKD